MKFIFSKLGFVFLAFFLLVYENTFFMNFLSIKFQIETQILKFFPKVYSKMVLKNYFLIWVDISSIF